MIFEPYVGHKYADTQLLLLGESAYSWEDENGLHHPGVNHCSELVEFTCENFNQAPRFMRTLSRALANELSPSADRLRDVWNCVAFTNFVSGSVGQGARTRPSDDMWQSARQSFQQDLLPRILPKRIIVLGKTMWSKMPEADRCISEDVQGYTNINGSVSLCWAVNHPSRGLSWQKLAEIIQFYCSESLNN